MKSIITVFLLVSFHVAFGQIAKGTWALGPDIDYSYSKIEIDGFDFKSTTSDLSLSAGVGYYVIDNLEIGISLGISSGKDETDGFESTSSTFIIGPSVTYKVNLSEQFYLPVGAGFFFNSGTTEDDASDEVKISGITYGAFIGIEFITNNKVGVSLYFGPEFGTLKEEETEIEFDATNLSAGMGFQFYF